MRKQYRQFVLIGCAICLMVGCSANDENDFIETVGENAVAKVTEREVFEDSVPVDATEKNVQMESDLSAEDSLFPKTYTETTEHVKFDCELEIPEEFDAESFYLPIADGVQYLNGDAAYQKYVEGETVAETYEYQSGDPELPDSSHYILADGTSVSIYGGFSYSRPEASIFRQVMRESEVGASQENFSFGTGEECISQVKEALAEMDFPVEEYAFYWFSLSGEEHAALEEERLAEGSIGEENRKEGGWEADESEYEIYAWQMYQGLPVFLHYMSGNMQAAFESYQIAPVTACFSKDGMLSLSAAEPYILEASEERAVFLPFSEIAGKVIEKYDRLLLEEESLYTVERAKLAVRMYVDGQSQYAAEPIWYFEVNNNMTYTEVLMFNAVTGEEIYLP